MAGQALRLRAVCAGKTGISGIRPGISPAIHVLPSPTLFRVLLRKDRQPSHVITGLVPVIPIT